MVPEDPMKGGGLPLAMKVAFIQHTAAIAVPPTVLFDLWRGGKVAIHWPGHGEAEVHSLDPQDYDEQGAKNAVAVFQALNSEGGLVIAESMARKGDVRVGRIQPGSFALHPTEWRPTALAKEKGHKRAPGSPTQLKTLQLAQYVEVGAKDVPGYQNIARRAACSWTNAVATQTLLDLWPELA